VRKERLKERERRGKNTRDVGTKKKSIVIVVGRGKAAANQCTRSEREKGQFSLTSLSSYSLKRPCTGKRKTWDLKKKRGEGKMVSQARGLLAPIFDMSTQQQTFLFTGVRPASQPGKASKKQQTSWKTKTGCREEKEEKECWSARERQKERYFSRLTLFSKYQAAQSIKPAKPFLYLYPI